MIRFNIPAYTGKEDAYISEVIKSHSYCGDGVMAQSCQDWLEKKFDAPKVLLTNSCSTALDMSALLCDIQPGDEVIVPSYTFSTSASSFALRGAHLVFVDIRPDTMNIDEKLIESAVTQKTRAIVVVHYAGVSCEMDAIMAIARKYHLKVVEDAAQGVMAYYKGQALGTIGDFGTYSFHETKNYNMGEGGALIVNHKSHFDRADNILDCGTNKKGYKAGKVSEYSWVELGSSLMPSEFSAAFLRGQLEDADAINQDRLNSWQLYHKRLMPLKNRGILELPVIPKDCCHNAHMYYIKAKNRSERDELMAYLRERGIMTASHYVPLHSSLAGKKYGHFHGEDRFTTKDSRRLTRLPLYYRLKEEEIVQVTDAIHAFYCR